MYSYCNTNQVHCFFFPSSADQLKEYRQQFELMLEGENQVDRCKQKLVTLEAKESKIRKDVKRSLKKGNEPEVEELQLQLKQASDATKLAQEEGPLVDLIAFFLRT